jgi:hypothetical protein
MRRLKAAEDDLEKRKELKKADKGKKYQVSGDGWKLEWDGNRWK